MSINLLIMREGWRWDDNKGGWLDRELCAKARREEVECLRRHKIRTRGPREMCLRETGKAPVKTGWAETDKGQPGKPNVRARWVAKEHKTHARRAELYASTPPLEALKVVLSEIATGERGGKVVTLVDVQRAYFYAPARRRVFVELPPEDYHVGETCTCAGCCNTACTARKIQTLKRAGRILNHVIEWDRDGITIDADQRHVRETLKGLELERANHSATPCAVERKNERNARSDESNGGEPTQTGTDSDQARVGRHG